MDNITHTLAGVAMGNAFFRERIGPEAVPILAWASNVTDIDAVVMLSAKRTSVLMRRTFGHSLLIVPLWALLLSIILRRFYPKVGWMPMIGLCLLGIVVHLLFDLVNSFGVVLLWPLSMWRPELSCVFIIDLFLAGCLAAPLVLGFAARLRPWKIRISQVSVVAAALYLGFCWINRAWALGALRNAEHPADASFVYAFPEPFGPHRWHGIIRDGAVYHQFLIHSLTGMIEPQGEVSTGTGDPIVEQARRSPLGQELEWFFKAPVWSAQTGNPALVDVYDLRFRPALLKRKESFQYHFRVYEDGRVENYQ